MKVRLAQLESAVKDIKDHVSEIKANARQVGSDISGLKDNIVGLESRLKDDIVGLESSLKDNIAGMESRLKDDISGIKTDFAGLSRDVIHLPTKDFISTRITWVLGVCVALAALVTFAPKLQAVLGM